MHLSWSFFSVCRLAISQVFHLVSLVGASHWLCKPELQSQLCHLLLCNLGRWFSCIPSLCCSKLFCGFLWHLELNPDSSAWGSSHSPFLPWISSSVFFSFAFQFLNMPV